MTRVRVSSRVTFSPRSRMKRRNGSSLAFVSRATNRFTRALLVSSGFNGPKSSTVWLRRKSRESGSERSIVVCWARTGPTFLIVTSTSMASPV